MQKRHPLLQGQVQKYLDEELLDEQLIAFLEAINVDYVNSENCKQLMQGDLKQRLNDYQESQDWLQRLQLQLIQQEKMAAIGQLAAGIAHEINNPLGYMQSNVETLGNYTAKVRMFLEKLQELRGKLQAEEVNKDDFVTQVERLRRQGKIDYILQDIDAVIAESLSGVQKINKIVKSLLGFARRGEIVEMVDYDLNQGIHDTLIVAHNEIKYHAQVVEELGEIPLVKAADDAINQVLLNIIINAVYAIKEKGDKGLIIVSTKLSEGYVVCRISDNGIGIPKQSLETIFEPFFTNKPAGVGTGLGLSIARDIIVNKHEGKIKVESEVGKGTTFVISLPAKSAV
ncbi:MAG: hypothetical protein LLG02_13170 [Pelosinus sp.]|nr:hypothetical protein [Pelosinus sp.]